MRIHLFSRGWHVAAAGGMLLATMLAAAGCSKFPGTFKNSVLPNEQANTTSLPPSGPTTVRVDSTALALNQPEQELAVRKAFVERFQTLLNEQRHSAAQLWIERHPDLAWEVLRDTESVGDAWLLSLAEFHDRQCTTDPTQGWRSLLDMRRTTPERDQAYRDTRRQFMQHLRSGRFAEAGTIDLVTSARQAEHPLLELDAWHQTGVAAMISEQPAVAVGALEQCLQLAQTYSPQEGVHIQLLLSEARRRAGDHEGASREWVAAVSAAADLLVGPTPIADPTFWDRAMYLQPVHLPWPEAVVTRTNQLIDRGVTHARTQDMQRVVEAARRSGRQVHPMLYVATCLGSWKLERGDAQGAVVAFKKAENLADPETIDWLRIAEAKAMVRLEQSAAATALLGQLASREDHTAAHYAAMADLGTLQLHDGRIPQGVNLLRRAINEQPHLEWPGKSSAEADFALALLMLGEEQEGLERLQQVKRRFEAEGDVESLAKCLWNETQFLKQTKNKAELAAVEKQLSLLRL